MNVWWHLHLAAAVRGRTIQTSRIWRNGLAPTATTAKSAQAWLKSALFIRGKVIRGKVIKWVRPLLGASTLGCIHSWVRPLLGATTLRLHKAIEVKPLEAWLDQDRGTLR